MSTAEAMRLMIPWFDSQYSTPEEWADHYQALRDYLDTYDGAHDLAAGEFVAVMMHRALAMRGSK
jgi:hypothetical protein